MTMADTEQMIARGLRINSVSPAAVSTGILDDFYKAFGDRVAKNVARAGRPGEPHEIADVIAFLASPQSAWIKGQDLVIDGGMSAMAASDALALKATNVGG
jgi:NAD(P)-dependent dehydrogenase (short-subunit alcohol dehydrogenase family)